MKTTLLIVAIFLVLSPRLKADPIPACTSGTLQSYINMAGGCEVGDQLFSGFSYASLIEESGIVGPPNPGQPNVPAAQITVTPIDTAGPGLEFSGSWSILETPFQALMFDLDFTVAEQPSNEVGTAGNLQLIDASPQTNDPLTGYVEMNDDAVYIENGGPVYPPGGWPYTQVLENLACSGCVPDAGAVDLTMALNSADLQSFNYTISETDPPAPDPVPEPASIVLFGSGLLFVWRKRVAA